MSEAFEKAMAARERERARYGMFKKRGFWWWTIALIFGGIVYAMTLVFMQATFG